MTRQQPEIEATSAARTVLKLLARPQLTMRNMEWGQSAMIEYRVTKYDPAKRDARGAYLCAEWTSFKDIGRAIGGAVLTAEEYRRVEQAYVDSALAFVAEGKLSSLIVEGLENPEKRPVKVQDGSVCSAEEIGELIRQLLREEYWCRLEAQSGFIHFGWDYYMYIGVPHRCVEAERLSRRMGLYPEEFASPYKRDDEVVTEG